MRLLVSLAGDSEKHIAALIECLRQAGIHPTGGGTDNQSGIILFDKPEDADLAIKWLKFAGLHAERG